MFFLIEFKASKQKKWKTESLPVILTIYRTASCVIELISLPQQPPQFPPFLVFFFVPIGQEAGSWPGTSRQQREPFSVAAAFHTSWIWSSSSGINTVIDIQHISYGVSGICVRAAHLLMNIKAVCVWGGGVGGWGGVCRQTEREQDTRAVMVVDPETPEVFRRASWCQVWRSRSGSAHSRTRDPPKTPTAGSFSRSSGISFLFYFYTFDFSFLQLIIIFPHSMTSMNFPD